MTNYVPTKGYIDAMNSYSHRNKLKPYMMIDFQKVNSEIYSALAKVYSLKEEEIIDGIVLGNHLPENFFEDEVILKDNLIKLIDVDVEPYTAAKTIVRGYLRRRLVNS